MNPLSAQPIAYFNVWLAEPIDMTDDSVAAVIELLNRHPMMEDETAQDYVMPLSQQCPTSWTVNGPPRQARWCRPVPKRYTQLSYTSSRQMRYHALVLDDPKIKRLMAHVTGDGACLLYQYDSAYDTSCIADDWFENLGQALDYSSTVYGVKRGDWSVVGATPLHCQDDWITPTRISGRETGNPKWGYLQQLINGQWTDLDMQALPKIEIDYSQLTPIDFDA